jgi:DNA-binding CsgD family transcriptional regulator
MIDQHLLSKKHPFISSSELLTPICDPLRSFNIHLFTYLKKFIDGSQVNVSTDARWIADYYRLDLHQTSTYDAELHEEGLALWPWDSTSRVFKHGRKYFDSVYGFTLCRQQADGWEFFFFSLAASQFKMLDTCLNNIDLIEEFTYYFKDKASNLLKSCNEQRIILPSRHSGSYIIESNDTIREQFSKIIKGHSLVKWLNNYEPLTKRETECLYLLMDYQTVTALADQLKLSKRTVETHVERIKAKLQCRSKQELLIKLTQFFKS